jgi:hypothetical protein
MGIQAGKTVVLYDDDPRLADVWKGNTGETKSRTESGDGGGGDGGGGDGGDGPTRPQLNDIILKGFETYNDSNGMQKQKAKFRIYNSSKQEIDGFLFALTISDTQGGRA